MGSAFSDWAEATGPIYMGADSSMEVVWTAVAVILCIAALISGSRHELKAYERMKSDK